MMGAMPMNMMRPPMMMNPMLDPAQRSKISNSLCETHFPEPIIFHTDRPICRQCLPELLEHQYQQKKKKNGFNQNQINHFANLLGISSVAMNPYQSQKQMISRCLDKIQEFRKDQFYFQIELKDREEQAEKHLALLPTQMSDMFTHLEELVNSQES